MFSVFPVSVGSLSMKLKCMLYIYIYIYIYVYIFESFINSLKLKSKHGQKVFLNEPNESEKT